MSSANEQSSSEKSDPPAHFDGRIFLVDGKKFHVETKILNVLVECSEFFRALLTLNFMESNQKEIEIKEVSKIDFDALVNIIRIYTEINQSEIEQKHKERELLAPLMPSLTEANIVSIVLLCDSLKVSNVIDMLIKVLDKVLKLQMLDMKKIDLIQLLESAFKTNHNDLKKYCVFLMRAVSHVLQPQFNFEAAKASASTSQQADMLAIHSVFKMNTFFVNNAERIATIDLEIRKYICEQYPTASNLINHE